MNACSAWVSLPVSQKSLRASRSTSFSARRRTAAKLRQARDTPSTAAITPATRPTTPTATRGRHLTALFSTRMLLSARPPPSSSALSYTARDQRHPAAVATLSSASPPWLTGRRVMRYARGRGARGFRLGAVTAVRSPGNGAAMTTAAVEGGEELREAFEAAVGEDGLLGLDGFRVSCFIF